MMNDYFFSVQKTSQTLMTPQIMFQCPHCYVKLNVPISFSGQTAPCPCCEHPIQTPAAFVLSPQVVSQTEEAPHRKWANPTSGFDSASIARSAFTKSDSGKRSEIRGVMPDNAVHRGDLEKKENRSLVKMLVLFALAMIVIGITIYFMKSGVASSQSPFAR